MSCLQAFPKTAPGEDISASAFSGYVRQLPALQADERLVRDCILHCSAQVVVLVCPLFRVPAILEQAPTHQLCLPCLSTAVIAVQLAINSTCSNPPSTVSGLLPRVICLAFSPKTLATEVIQSSLVQSRRGCDCNASLTAFHICSLS